MDRTTARRPLVAANWKMHGTRREADELACGVRAALGGATLAAEIVVCPPFTALQTVCDVLRGSGIELGAQHLHEAASGAFTGEISAAMLVDAGCRHVIVGHSERRTLFAETDDAVNRKLHAALDAGLTPIFCVGETLEQREAEETDDVLRTQVRAGLAGLGAGIARIVVAYEPVWAIGTGRTAAPEQAQDAHATIRELLGDLGGTAVGETVRVLYGGSVKPANARELFALPDVDGGLIGGASLEAGSFAAIVRAAG